MLTLLEIKASRHRRRHSTGIGTSLVILSEKQGRSGIITRRAAVKGWEAKRLKGCVFSPPSLLPVPGRGNEANSAASTNGSFPTLLHVSIYTARMTQSRSGNGVTL